MLMLLLGVVAAVVLFYYFIIKPYDYWKVRGVKQGRTVWILGDNWKMFTQKQTINEMVQYVYNQYQDVRYSGIYQFRLPTLLVKDPDLMKQITIKDFDNFVDHRTFIPKDADPLWGNNLFNLKGQKWRDMRSILSPSFTSSKMRIMFKLISECAENFVRHFTEMKEDVVTVELKDAFSRFTTNVIASTAFGLEIDCLAQPNHHFFLMGKNATDFATVRFQLTALGHVLFPTLCSYLKVPLFTREVSDYFPEIIRNVIKMRKEEGIVRPDMINLLLEARNSVQNHEAPGVLNIGFSRQKADLDKTEKSAKQPKELTDLYIAAQAMIFFFAGFDAVSGLMCFVSYELSVNADIQDRLRKEIRSTLNECGGKLTYVALLRMKYMDMVVSETLRKWPIAPVADRISTQPYTIKPVYADERPLNLEKGTVIWLPIYGLQHDPKYFPDPERFDPERFSDENKGNIKPYTYFPFGLGPRNCIGSRFTVLEVKMVIFHILNNFELVPVEKSRIPLKISNKHFNLHAEGGFWFGLKRINAWKLLF